MQEEKRKAEELPKDSPQKQKNNVEIHLDPTQAQSLDSYLK